MPADQPLTSTELAAWQPFLDGARALLDRLDRTLQSDNNITHSYLEILLPLSQAPEQRLRMSELAQRTRSSRSRLTHAIDRLEERGFVSRSEHDADKRGHVAHLTSAGAELVDQAAPAYARSVRSLVLDQLTAAEFQALGQLGQLLLKTSDARHD